MKEKRAVVLGLGLSGQGAARWLISQGFSVLGVDQKVEMARESLAFLEQEGVSLASFVEDWTNVELVALSPGISPVHPVCLEAKERGIDVVGEAEMALSYIKKPMVACTGTNGKTSVVLLVEHVLNINGISAKALGNVGSSLCQYALEGGDEEVLVIELSSYQLETMKTPVFQEAVVLNITPDHLERYESVREYARAKSVLPSLVKEGGGCTVYDKTAAQYPDFFGTNPTFGTEELSDWQLQGRSVYKRGKHLFDFPENFSSYSHDLENGLAAYLLCRALGVTLKQFVKGVASFKKPAHRMEWVDDIKEVSYYDDSKGTNVDATVKAVAALEKGIVLIAGGVDKGFSYAPWKEAFAQRVKAIVVIGEAAVKIERELGDFVSVTRAISMQEAVNLAASMAEPGECVLLSPGCASFDQFRSYAHRGEEFKKSVYYLKESEDESERGNDSRGTSECGTTDSSLCERLKN